MLKKTKAIAFSALVLIALLVATWATFRFLIPSTTPAIEEPVSAGVGTPRSYIPPEFQRQATSSIESKRTFIVRGEDGRTIPVKDFTKTAVQDRNNTGIKYLAGGGEEKVLDGAPYILSYLAGDSSFTVALFAQPIGSVRSRAESDLLLQLGISEEEACFLRYVVLVPFEVDKNYAGRNLGFSFCEGAVSLP